MKLISRAARASLVPLILVALLSASATTVLAFNGPFATTVTVEAGVDLDVDVRWPDTGTPPPAGWPVIFFAHGAGGSKNSNAGRAADYADDGYVTFTYTNRADATAQTPDVFASDLTALKTWMLDSFESAASVTVPMDPTAFGMTGNSLGAYVTWSGVTLTDLFAAVVPFNWSLHTFVDHIVSQGSLERQTGADIAALVGGEYPSAAVDAALEGVFDPLIANFSAVTIPVQNHMAMLDARASGSQALSDHLALTSSAKRIVYLGTGGHSTPNNDATFRDDLRQRFFDLYLKGDANGIDAEDPIQLALLGTNEHISYPTWPPPGQNDATVYLGAAGTLLPDAPTAASASDAFDNDPGGLTWAAAAPDFSVSLIRSQVVREVLAYDTDPLSEEVLVVGEPNVTLWVEGTGSRYQVNVHLFDVSPTGDPILLAFGTATTDASPIQLDIPLTMTGRRIPAGHRLRLEITNRDDQDVDPTDAYSPETGRLRYLPFFEFSANDVFREAPRPSSLTIPLIGTSTLPVAPPTVPGLPGAELGVLAVFLAVVARWKLAGRESQSRRLD